jgi:hypothetical protein
MVLTEGLVKFQQGRLLRPDPDVAARPTFAALQRLKWELERTTLKASGEFSLMG